MADFESIQYVRALSQNDVSKMTNPQLKKALATILGAEQIEPNTDPVLVELREIKDSIRKLSEVKEEVKELSVKLNSAFEIIHQQQIFLESLDNKERRCNLVITGLPEIADDIGSNDPEKLKTVFNKAKCPSDIDPSGFTLRRLGQPNDQQKRFLHVTCNSQQQRDKIIATAKELKSAGENFKNIYIKKDIHPAIRKELGRLRKRAYDEKNKPDNSDATIEYDPKNRVVTRNGLVIDRFYPKFF